MVYSALVNPAPVAILTGNEEKIDCQVRKVGLGNIGLPIVTMQSTEIHTDDV